MDQTESRLAPSPETASDDVASPFSSPACERQDLLAFEPVPLRYRGDGLTPEKQRAYVEALADSGIVREAAARVGVSEQAINRVRRRADARSFDRACEAAHMFGARRLRSIAYQRAIEGTLKGHYYHGERVGEERVHDNRLLVYLLGKTEHLLEPPRESRTICENWEEHMDALEQGLPAPDLSPQASAAPEKARPEFTGYELTEDDDGIWWTGFPPPEDFDGESLGEFGDYDYKRTLSPREQAVLDSDQEQALEEERAREADRRDRYFGFAGGEFSFPMEAEPSETSEPSREDDRGEGPIEFKSLVPPSFHLPAPGTCSAPSRIVKVHAEARRRGGGRPIPPCASPPARAGNNLQSGFAGSAVETRPLCTSAPPREPRSGRSETRRRTFPGTAHIQTALPRHP